MSMGLLFSAPLGSTEWIELGVAEECHFEYTETDPVTGALLEMDLHGRCASLSMPVGAFSAYSYWILFRRRHPRVKAMHRAYRRRVRSRRGTRRTR